MSAAAKSRACPAAGREIRSYECTDGRHSKFACPESCPHNPFSGPNYDRLLEIERVLDERFQSRLAQERNTHARDVQTLAEAIASNDANRAFSTFRWLTLGKRDAAGRTFVDRWEHEGFAGLKNDARVLLKAQSQMRPALIEVRRILDDTRTEVVDLLDPEPRPFLIYDRGLASAANRFSTLVMFLVTLPHYTRIHGNPNQVPSLHTLDPDQALRRLVSFLGGPEKTDELRRWLLEHEEKVEAALDAIVLARRHTSLKRTQAHFGKAVYRIHGDPEECRRICSRTPGIEPTELSAEERNEGFTGARIWLDATQSAMPGVPVLGRILIGPVLWRLEAVGRERLATLRDRFETIMGPRARFEGERLDNLAARLNLETPDYDASLVPPEFLNDVHGLSTFITSGQTALLDLDPSVDPESPEGIRRLCEAMDQAFLDTQVPALDQKTPREAARDRALRPRLIRLLKERIESGDIQSREDQVHYDAAWLAQELGIDELVLPPPPLRPPLELDEDEEDQEDTDDDDNDTEDDVESDVDPEVELEGYPPQIIPALEDLPPVPLRELTREESGLRLGRALNFMPDIPSKGPLLYYASQMAIGLSYHFDGEINHEEQAMLLGTVLCTSLLFYQPGVGAPMPALEEFEKAFQDVGKRIARETPEEDPSPDRFLHCSIQPAMARAAIYAVLNQVMEASESDHTDNRRHFKEDDMVVLLYLILGLVEAMDREIRPRQQL